MKGWPNTRVQRTRRPRLRAGRSLRSLGSPLTHHPLGAPARYFAVASSLLFLSNIASGQYQATLEKAAATYEARHPEAEKVGGRVKAPKLVHHVNPEFSEAARKKKREMSPIVLMAVVSEAGELLDPTIIMSAHPDLNPSVLAAVKQWKYEPARKDDKPVKVFLTITVTLEPGRA